MRKRILVLLVIITFMGILRSAPPAPQSWWQTDMSFAGVSEKYGGNGIERDQNLPGSILVLRCQFSDVSFDLDPAYPPGKPDTLPHDAAYFERFMFHLAAYWNDASQGEYELTESNYTIYPEVFTLNQEMAYYGDDDLSQERVSEMIVELLDLGDAEIDYSAYDNFIIFHAGAGQEADISGANTADVWTTFVTRKTLQAGLDPENDDFPGLQYDGTVLKEFIIVPETERQPDIQENDLVFGVLGVLCHEFGRQLGLPILYDNQSSNGKSAGIGNYGVMGTGLWNAAGYVPPLPCAWCRIYLGWEECVTVSSDLENAELTYPMNAEAMIPTIYKVMISDDEYYLLENRRQNPDGSIFINAAGDTLASFSFEIIENQQYYEEGHPYAGQPYFNFMENTYAGCEWDFYLPGYGEGDSLNYDGSGICIWHVDEIVMREKFNPSEEINVPNGEEEHKAIDLEEADGSQGLDLYGYYGYKDDTYRQGNNDYFGYLEHNGFPWSPTAESYYGGIQLEVYDISEATSVMTFSVAFEWSLDTGYTGKNTLPAAFLDFGDGVEKLFYPMPDASLFMWEDNNLIAQEQILRDTIPQCWAWLESEKQILIPAASGHAVSLHAFNEHFQSMNQALFIGYRWAAPPLVVEGSGEDEARIVLAFNNINETYGSRIVICNSDLDEIYSYSLEYLTINTNMMYDGALHVPGRNGDFFQLHRIGVYEESLVEELSIESDYKFCNGLISQLTEGGEKKMFFSTTDKIIVQFRKTLNGFELEKMIELPFICNSYPSYGDLDNNGSQELIFGGENSFVAIDEQGNIHKPYYEIMAPDSSGIYAGVVPIDLENDGNLEIVGMMSRNRLCIWENHQDNDYRMRRYYPVSYGHRSRLYPLARDNVIYLPSDNGRIFRDTNFILGSDNLPVAYGNLERTGYIPYHLGVNEHETAKLFVDSETYIYPNPYSSIFNSTIFNGREETGKIGVRIMLSANGKVEIRIYDIAGNRVESGEIELAAYFADVYLIDATRLASGVYIACLETGKEQKIIKFGIEK